MSTDPTNQTTRRARPTYDEERTERVERARLAFGDALSTRVKMKTKLGDVPVQMIREAMSEALDAADFTTTSLKEKLRRIDAACRDDGEME